MQSCLEGHASNLIPHGMLDLTAVGSGMLDRTAVSTGCSNDKQEYKFEWMKRKFKF